jgi:hypothetical protein
VVGCVLLAIIVSLAVLFNSSTLSYEGESLNEWLVCFDSEYGLSPETLQERARKKADAKHALRQMGPAVLPQLRRMLKPDAGPARFLRELKQEIARQPLSVGSAVPPSSEEVRMLRAVEACSALGPDAQAMIPDLLRVMKSNSYLNVRSRAAYALGEIGGAPEEVVPALVQSLSNSTDGNVLISLGKYGADANTAVPSIVALLNGIETSVKEHTSFDRNSLCEAARALQQIDPREGEKTVPLLRQVLQEEHDPFWRSRLVKLVNAISSGAAPNNLVK